MKRQAPKRSLLAVAIATAFAPAWAQPTVTTATVEVVGTTPLAGIGVPRLHLPSNVLSLDDRRLDEIESLNIAEQLQRQAPAVTVNGNPGQPLPGRPELPRLHGFALARHGPGPVDLCRRCARQ